MINAPLLDKLATMIVAHMDRTDYQSAGDMAQEAYARAAAMVEERERHQATNSGSAAEEEVPGPAAWVTELAASVAGSVPGAQEIHAIRAARAANLPREYTLAEVLGIGAKLESWAIAVAVDADGAVWQYSAVPTFSEAAGTWDANCEQLLEVGRVVAPFSAKNCLFLVEHETMVDR